MSLPSCLEEVFTSAVARNLAAVRLLFGGCCPADPHVNLSQAISAMTVSCFPKDQNGDSHHVGDLKISGKEFLSLPARSKKYREHQSSSERRAQGSSTSPLDTSEVRVHVSQSVGRCFFPPVLIWTFLIACLFLPHF